MGRIDDNSDGRSFVLYITRGPVACEKVLEVCKGREDIVVQDVKSIQGPRPDWLRGVPTVVELPGLAIFTGSAAIERLENSRPPPAHYDSVSPQPSGTPSLLGGSPLEFAFNETACHQDIDERYNELPPENLSKWTLEDMVRRRGAG